jgi:hypothetical protein
VYARRQDKPTIYEVDRGILDKLEKPAASYRNMQLAIFNRFDVVRVKLVRGNDTVELLKDNGNWRLPTDPKQKIDNGKVEGFLTNLQDTKIAEFAKAKVASPELTIRLFEKNPKEKGEVEKVALSFGKLKTKKVPVERAGLNLPFTIKEDDFRKIDLGRDAFFAKPEKKEDKKAEKSEIKNPGAAKKS